MYSFTKFTAYTLPGNDVRSSQSYANEILTSASGHDLQAVHRISTNVLSCYLLISQRENRQFGNVVMNSFHFYTRLNTSSRGKTDNLTFYLKQMYPTAPRSG